MIVERSLLHYWPSYVVGVSTSFFSTGGKDNLLTVLVFIIIKVIDNLIRAGGLIIVGSVAPSCFTLVHLAAAEGCFIHFLAIVHLLVAHELCLLLLKLKVRNWLRSWRGAICTLLL